MAEKSLYKHILDNITDGVLSEDFSLPGKEEAGGLKFADGAWDGMIRYHMDNSVLDATGTKLMVRALSAVSKQDYDRADVLFSELGKNYKAISIVDDFQSYIAKHVKKYPSQSIYDTAIHLILHSSDKESVKFGIEMLELLIPLDSMTKDMLRTVGLSDEFTIFVLWVLKQWGGGNREIFKLAQKVNGWGKIHAVEMLEADTEEIKEWLCLHGIRNNVTDQYSALTVWKKADIANKLTQELSDREFAAITDIIDALIDEGPVPGISAVDDAGMHLLHYLQQASERKLFLKAYEVILEIRNWAENEHRDETIFSSAVNKADQLLLSSDCQETVINAVKNGKGLRIARFLSIPFLDELYHCLKTDFSNHYHQCRYLMKDSEYINATVRLFEENIPLEQIIGDPKDGFISSENHEICMQLGFILQELRNKPFVGSALVTAGLHAVDIRNRNGALRVLQGWTLERRQPLSEFSPEFYQEVSDLKQREVNTAAMETIDRLLNGELLSEEDDEYE